MVTIMIAAAPNRIWPSSRGVPFATKDLLLARPAPAKDAKRAACPTYRREASSIPEPPSPLWSAVACHRFSERIRATVVFSAKRRLDSVVLPKAARDESFAGAAR
jgi:hypothetical protein